MNHSHQQLQQQQHKITQKLNQLQNHINQHLSSFESHHLIHFQTTFVYHLHQKISNLINLLSARLQQITQLIPIRNRQKKTQIQTSQSQYLLQNFDVNSQIKTKNDFEYISQTNDHLYKQYEELISNYHQQRQALNYKKEVVVNQWLQNANQVTSYSNKNLTFLSLIKSLVVQLSKYESVEEHINCIQSIENQTIINELKTTSMADIEDKEKKWLKEITREYLLRMAELMKSQNDQFLDNQVDSIIEDELQHMF